MNLLTDSSSKRNMQALTWKDIDTAPETVNTLEELEDAAVPGQVWETGRDYGDVYYLVVNIIPINLEMKDPDPERGYWFIRGGVQWYNAKKRPVPIDKADCVNVSHFPMKLVSGDVTKWQRQKKTVAWKDIQNDEPITSWEEFETLLAPGQIWHTLDGEPGRSVPYIVTHPTAQPSIRQTPGAGDQYGVLINAWWNNTPEYDDTLPQRRSIQIALYSDALPVELVSGQIKQAWQQVNEEDDKELGVRIPGAIISQHIQEEMPSLDAELYYSNGERATPNWLSICNKYPDIAERIKGHAVELYGHIFDECQCVLLPIVKGTGWSRNTNDTFSYFTMMARGSERDLQKLERKMYLLWQRGLTASKLSWKEIDETLTHEDVIQEIIKYALSKKCTLVYPDTSDDTGNLWIEGIPERFLNVIFVSNDTGTGKYLVTVIDKSAGEGTLDEELDYVTLLQHSRDRVIAWSKNAIDTYLGPDTTVLQTRAWKEIDMQATADTMEELLSKAKWNQVWKEDAVASSESPDPCPYLVMTASNFTVSSHDDTTWNIQDNTAVWYREDKTRDAVASLINKVCFPMVLVSDNFEQWKKEPDMNTTTASLHVRAALTPALTEALKREIAYKLEHNRQEFPAVSSYVTDDMIAQDAFNVVLKEQHVTDARTIAELKEYSETELGHTIYHAPYLDWLGMMNRAHNDVQYFVKNQKTISPDMRVTDKELARDWWNLWQQEVVPSDVKTASWFESMFLPTVKKIVEDLGLGDITSTVYQAPPPIEDQTSKIINPSDNDEGEKEFVDTTGKPAAPEPGVESENEPPAEKPIFTPPSAGEVDRTKQEMIDQLLDKLHEATTRGDQNEIATLKKRLQELSVLSSKLAWGAAKLSYIDLDEEAMGQKQPKKRWRRYVPEFNSKQYQDWSKQYYSKEELVGILSHITYSELPEYIHTYVSNYFKDVLAEYPDLQTVFDNFVIDFKLQKDASAGQGAEYFEKENRMEWYADWEYMLFKKDRVTPEQVRKEMIQKYLNKTIIHELTHAVQWYFKSHNITHPNVSAYPDQEHPEYYQYKDVYHNDPGEVQARDVSEKFQFPDEFKGRRYYSLGKLAWKHIDESEAAEEDYAAGQARCNIQVGDMVRVTRAAASKEGGWSAAWTYQMDGAVGKTGKVVEERPSGFAVYISGVASWHVNEEAHAWFYPYFVLEKVATPTVLSWKDIEPEQEIMRYPYSFTVAADDVEHAYHAGGMDNTEEGRLKLLTYVFNDITKKGKLWEWKQDNMRSRTGVPTLNLSTRINAFSQDATNPDPDHVPQITVHTYVEGTAADIMKACQVLPNFDASRMRPLSFYGDSKIGSKLSWKKVYPEKPSVAVWNVKQFLQKARPNQIWQDGDAYIVLGPKFRQRGGWTYGMENCEDWDTAFYTVHNPDTIENDSPWSIDDWSFPIDLVYKK